VSHWHPKGRTSTNSRENKRLCRTQGVNSFLHRPNTLHTYLFNIRTTLKGRDGGGESV
jgi:hypothetical protein